VIIGNGNVALDVARMLAKSPEEFAGSDVAGEFMAWLTAQPLKTIHLVGRRAAAEARFSDHELAELGTLQRARPVVSDPASLTGDTAVVKTLRGFAESVARDTPVTINFHFNLTPTEFAGDGRLQEVRFRSANGQTVILPAQLAVACIGYEVLPCCSVAPVNGVFANQDGKVAERLYVVGWAKRGPSGTIPTNRVEAQQLAQKIAQETQSGERPGGAGLRKLLQERNARWVDYTGWRRIDAAELARAAAGRAREKFTSPDEMLDAAVGP
jgi:ferredoxin--NADP+ reductase